MVAGSHRDIAFTLLALQQLHCTSAVSYTHLDVYKRQLKIDDDWSGLGFILSKINKRFRTPQNIIN